MCDTYLLVYKFKDLTILTIIVGISYEKVPFLYVVIYYSISMVYAILVLI